MEMNVFTSAIINVRNASTTTLHIAEHACAFGYALHEFDFHYSKGVLWFASLLLLIAWLSLIFHKAIRLIIIRNENRIKRYAEKEFDL